MHIFCSYASIFVHLADKINILRISLFKFLQNCVRSRQKINALKKKKNSYNYDSTLIIVTQLNKRCNHEWIELKLCR